MNPIFLLLYSEHENLVAERQVASSKITELIMDWQLQSELQMLKMKVFESEKLEEKLSIQANKLSGKVINLGSDTFGNPIFKRSYTITLESRINEQVVY